MSYGMKHSGILLSLFIQYSDDADLNLFFLIKIVLLANHIDKIISLDFEIKKFVNEVDQSFVFFFVFFVSSI